MNKFDNQLCLEIKPLRHKAFKEGREEAADEPRSGRPTTARTDENVDRVLEVLRTDRRLSIQQIADTLHMSTFMVHGIVTEGLQMRKVWAKLVPKVLTQDHKELKSFALSRINEPDFLNSVVTGDESWMFEYDPESKRQSCAWYTKSSLRPKKARMSKSRIKTMIIVFFDIRGIVHCEFVPQGQTTDIKDTVKLHHDNATSHTAIIITNFLARSNTPVIPHPPYSPDLAPCDFFLFPRLKREMKGKYWETVENIQHHVTTFLRSIPVEEFQGAFQSWQTRLRKCIDAGGMIMTEKREHLTNGKKLARSEATRRLLAAIIWQMTVALRRVDTTRLETAFQSPTPGRDDDRATASGESHRDLTPTTEESSTAMPYPYTRTRKQSTRPRTVQIVRKRSIRVKAVQMASFPPSIPRTVQSVPSPKQPAQAKDAPEETFQD
ncbi:hypothetical protein LAZ67_12000097 [Cordylochernes scorpioides]|uniref:Transposase n=1 Tax=Cordylochernes scorpioides TaxID=51811 RepID=A0ABY6L070_9ARAC|nr:hypothetical protein LAZ67_12000097 [Cordylochernes scorpioides]